MSIDSNDREITDSGEPRRLDLIPNRSENEFAAALSLFRTSANGTSPGDGFLSRGAFSTPSRRRIALALIAACAWLTVGPTVAEANATKKVEGAKVGHARQLTALEMSRIIGAGPPSPTGGLNPVDRSVDGQTGSPFDWEGSAGDTNTVNGNKLTELPLTGWTARGGMGVAAVLYHNSLATTGSEVGDGWLHSYSIYGVVDNTTGDFSIRWGNGLGYRFVKNMDGSFSAPLGIDETLVKDSTGYTLTTHGQVRYRFEGGTGNRRNCIWIKDRSDNEITIAHDSNDYVTSVTDPSGRALTFTYSSGKLSSITDAASRTFTLTHSGSNLTSVAFPSVSGGTPTVSYAYSSGRITSITDPRGKVWTFGYTSGGATSWEKNPLNQQTDYTYNTGAGTTTVTDPMSRSMVHTYSGGKLASVTAPGSAVTSFSYDSNYRRIQTTSPSGISVSLTYDSQGNVTSTTDSSFNVTNYTFNSKNDVTSITSPMGKVTSFSYDTAGRLVSATDALSHTTTFTVNSYGLLTQESDALGKVTTFGYDTYGNRTSGTDATSRTTTTAYNTLGMPTSATVGGLTATTTYDALDRVTSITMPGSYTSNRTYDLAGNTLTITNELGQVNSFTCNCSGHAKLGLMGAARKTESIAARAEIPCLPTVDR